MKNIVLAGGCFWGVEAYFKLVPGVLSTTVGYIDGLKQDPTYEEVCAGSGHAEAVLVEYDESLCDFYTLLDHYFNIVDPTQFNKQGPDIGVQYRSGFYNVEESDRAKLTQALKAREAKSVRPFHLTVKHDLPFYEAEAYHQDYLDKKPNGYCHVNLDSIRRIK